MRLAKKKDWFVYFKPVLKRGSWHKKQTGVEIDIYTCTKAKITDTDIKEFNAQYPEHALTRTDKMHDRFLIIDGKELYHFGHSLKDLGKQGCYFDKAPYPELLIPKIMGSI